MKFFEMLEGTTRFSAFLRNLFIIGISPIIASVDFAYAIDTKIAFISTRDDNAEIYVMDTDGTDTVRLTKHSVIDSYPAWSPDGTKIAFTSNRRNGATHEIYIMDADGKRPVRLTKNNQPVPAYDESPSWSPDGRKIAFASNREGNSEIYVMDTNGKNIVQLTRTLAREVTPSWSPDGSQIAYVSRDINADSDIYVMNADGAKPVNLTRNPRARNRDPSWSPDGRLIAFESRGVGNHDIYVMGADGSNLVRLTHHVAWDAYPSWSPDGRHIVFTSLRNLEREEPFLMNPDGTNIIQLTHGSEREMNRMASWHPAPQAVSSRGRLVIQWGRVKQSRQSVDLMQIGHVNGKKCG